MSTLTVEHVEKVVAGWRTGLESVDGWESPAGALFCSGDFAEADIVLREVRTGSEFLDPFMRLSC